MSLTGPGSSTLPPELPVVTRIKLVVSEMMSFIEIRGKTTPELSQYARYTHFVRIMMEELFDEMQESGKLTDDAFGDWLDQFGVIMKWCGTGDDTLLPPQVAEFLRREHPEVLAITS